jgi:alginate O-acetyltransferase complex protein AlgI
MRWRWLPLLAASLLFCASLGGVAPLALVVVAAINYIVGLTISTHRVDATARRVWLAIGVSAGLAPMVMLKYSGFIAEQLSIVLPVLREDVSFFGSNILYPLGISFYSLQALNYTIDVYRGKLPPEKHIGRFVLYVAFFPQVLAGPIGRAVDMLVQYRSGGFVAYERIVGGLQMVLWGLFQKVVVADRLALYVDRIYASPSAYSAGSLVLACYMFSFQIYCDFAGYSNIAIGFARILGYDLPQNFFLPYFASSLCAFWHRWHISLTSWFRDYLYISLGGNRVKASRWGLNIIAVFLCSGLWHGSNWTFLVWGVLHGVWYLLERSACRVVPLAFRSSVFGRLVGMVVTFHLITIAWILFRSPSLAVAGEIIVGIASKPFFPLYLGASQLTTLLSIFFVVVLLLVEVGQALGYVSMHAGSTRCGRVVRWCGYVILILLIATFGMHGNRFIYYQF